MKTKKLLLAFMISCTVLVGCKPSDSESVVSKDVKAEAKEEENKIRDTIDQGKILLNEGKYDEAKEKFEEVISKNKTNDKIYKEIKKIYMNKERYDDAYYIVNMAIENNVDVENMKKSLEEIKSKFEVISLNNSVYQNESFSLPNAVKFTVNGESVEKEVAWNNTNIDTSTLGTYNYEGTIESYGRTVKQVLTVKEKPVDKYVNEELGFSMIFPDNWKGKYEVKEQNEIDYGENGIVILYKSSSNIEGYGTLFMIYEYKPDKEQFIDTIYGAKRFIEAKGKKYIIGGPTGLGYSDTESDFNEYYKLSNERKDVINSIQLLQ